MEKSFQKRVIAEFHLLYQELYGSVQRDVFLESGHPEGCSPFNGRVWFIPFPGFKVQSQMTTSRPCQDQMRLQFTLKSLLWTSNKDNCKEKISELSDVTHSLLPLKPSAMIILLAIMIFKIPSLVYSTAFIDLVLLIPGLQNSQNIIYALSRFSAQ